MNQLRLSPEVVVTIKGNDFVSSTAPKDATVSALIRAADMHEAKAKQLRKLIYQAVRGK